MVLFTGEHTPHYVSPPAIAAPNHHHCLGISLEEAGYGGQYGMKHAIVVAIVWILMKK